MLTPIFEADIVVIQLEREREKEERQQIKLKQDQLSQRLRHLSRIIDAAPIDDTLKGSQHDNARNSPNHNRLPRSGS